MTLGNPGGSREIQLASQKMGTTSPDLYLVRRARPPGSARADRGRRSGLRSATVGCSPAPGCRPTRALAADFGVTRRVVVEAVRPARRRGVRVRPTGRGHRRERPGPRSGRAALAAAAPPRGSSVDFRLGLPDHALFPRTACARANRAAFAGLGAAELDGADRRALPALRTALAEYLGRVRGVDATRTGSWSARASRTLSTCWYRCCRSTASPSRSPATRCPATASPATRARSTRSRRRRGAGRARAVPDRGAGRGGQRRHTRVRPGSR